MPRAKPSPLGHPKPHYLAYVAETPCERCGYDWLRPALDFSNPDAEEIPTFPVCAKCGKRRGVNESLLPVSSPEETLGRASEEDQPR
jgi:hypothetical protein